jgi:trehalose-phosphatase
MTTPNERRLQHVLRAWTAVEQFLTDHRNLMLLCDYDGTLAPIKPRPALAVLPVRTQRVLRELFHQRQVTLGVVSGRALASLRVNVGLRHIWYLGNHGAEIQGPGIHFVHPDIQAAMPTLKTILHHLRRSLRGYPGLHIESKRLSLSVHWREVDEAQRPALQRHFRMVMQPWLKKDAVRLTHGKCVYEVRAAVHWDKGQGITWLVERLKANAAAVIYIGDDLTDEDGFRAVNRLHGLSVHVGSSNAKTRARWYLDGPTQVRQFLRRLNQFYARHGR